MKTIKKVDVLSSAKLSGVLYAVIGLIFGALISLFSLVFSGQEGSMMFGVGAIVILPVFYGVLGFLGGALSAGLYNVGAGWVGGIKVELE